MAKVEFDNFRSRSKMTDTGEIYCITNTSNGKQYIGQVFAFIMNRGSYIEKGTKIRFREHLSYSHSDHSKRNDCPKLYAAMRRYGTENFVVETILVCNKSMLNYFERLFIQKMDTIANGYNVTCGGNRYEMSEETKKTTSENMTKKWKDEEYKTHMITVHKKQWETDAYRKTRTEKREAKVKKNGLPCYISYKKNGSVIIGYGVDITINGKKHTKSWCSVSVPMEEKLQHAKDFIQSVKSNSK